MIFNIQSARADGLFPDGTTLTCASTSWKFAYDETNHKVWIGGWQIEDTILWQELTDVRFVPVENKLEIYATSKKEPFTFDSKHTITYDTKQEPAMKLAMKDVGADPSKFEDMEVKFICLKVTPSKEEPAKEPEKTSTDYAGLLSCIDPTTNTVLVVSLDKKLNGLPKKDGSYKNGVMLSMYAANVKPIDKTGELKVENGKLVSAETDEFNSRIFWKSLMVYGDEIIDSNMSEDATAKISVAFSYDQTDDNNISSVIMTVSLFGDYDFDGEGNFEPIDPVKNPPSKSTYECTPYVEPKLKPGSKEEKGK